MVHEDKDCKLILTLINIERTKPSDFFFGVHSLFRTLASTSITKLPFSTSTSLISFLVSMILWRNCLISETWFCIWEFEQLTTCDYLQTVMVDSFPRLSELSQVNMAYIASDKLMYLLARYCQKLEELNVDNCHKITEKGIRFLAGMFIVQPKRYHKFSFHYLWRIFRQKSFIATRVIRTYWLQESQSFESPRLYISDWSSHMVCFDSSQKASILEVIKLSEIFTFSYNEKLIFEFHIS